MCMLPTHLCVHPGHLPSARESCTAWTTCCTHSTHSTTQHTQHTATACMSEHMPARHLYVVYVGSFKWLHAGRVIFTLLSASPAAKALSLPAVRESACCWHSTPPNFRLTLKPETATPPKPQTAHLNSSRPQSRSWLQKHTKQQQHIASTGGGNWSVWGMCAADQKLSCKVPRMRPDAASAAAVVAEQPRASTATTAVPLMRVAFPSCSS